MPTSIADRYSFENSATTRGNFTISVDQGVLANDIGDALSAGIVFGTGYGRIAMSKDGSFSYQTFDPSFSGTDQFIYRSTNTEGVSQQTLVSINVNYAGPKPVVPVTHSDTYTFANGRNAVDADRGVLTNDTAVTTAKLVYNTAHGALDFHADGSFSYTSYDPSFVGVDEFIYKRADDGGFLSETKVILNVTAGTPAPVAAAEKYEVDASNVISVNAQNGVLANDIGNGLKAHLDFQTSYGVVNLKADGSFTYTPIEGANYTGKDFFIYTATDGSHDSVQTRVEIDVHEIKPITVTQPTLLTFEDLPLYDESFAGPPIGSHYAGFTWEGWGQVYDAQLLRASYGVPSGYTIADASGPKVLHSGFVNNDPAISAEPTIASDDGHAFDFQSGFFTSAWANGATLTVDGFLDGKQVASQSFTIDTTHRAFVEFSHDFDHVDQLSFSSKGGVMNGYGSGHLIVVDDLLFA